MNIDKPQNLYTIRNLQFQPSTTCIKMLPLQNQESGIAHPCRHSGCPKKMFWRTPRDPDFGKDFFGVLHVYIYIYVYTYIVNIFRALLKVNHVACLITPASPTFFGVLRTFSVVLARYTSHASTSPNSMWTAWHWRYCSPSTLKLKGTTRSLGILFSISLGLIGT